MQCYKITTGSSSGSLTMPNLLPLLSMSAKKKSQKPVKLPGQKQAKEQQVPEHEKPIQDVILPLLDNDLQVRYLRDTENPTLYLNIQATRQSNRIANAMASVRG